MELIDVYSRRDAALQLWHLLAERQEGESISHRAMPSWGEHKAYVDSRPYRTWRFIVDDDRIAGAVYATHRNEIGVQVFSVCRGMGYARRALEALIEAVPPLDAIPGVRPGTWVANINPRNRASVALFKSMGFKHVQNTYALRDR